MSSAEELARIILATGLREDLRNGVPKLWHLAALKIEGVTLAVENILHLPGTDTYEYFRENYERKHFTGFSDRYDAKQNLRRAIQDQNQDDVGLVLTYWNLYPSSITHGNRVVAYQLDGKTLAWMMDDRLSTAIIQLYLNGHRDLAISLLMNDVRLYFKPKLAFLAGRANDQDLLTGIMPQYISELRNMAGAGLVRGGHFDEFRKSYLSTLNSPHVLKEIGRSSNLNFLALLNESDRNFERVVESALKYGNLHLLRNLKTPIKVDAELIVSGGRIYMMKQPLVKDSEAPISTLPMIRLRNFYSFTYLDMKLERKGLTYAREVARSYHRNLQQALTPKPTLNTPTISMSKLHATETTRILISEASDWISRMNHVPAFTQSQAAGRIFRTEPTPVVNTRSPSLRQLKSQNRRQQRRR